MKSVPPSEILRQCSELPPAPPGVFVLGFVCLALFFGPGFPVAGQESSRDAGLPVESDAVIEGCGSCHTVDSAGRMSRISYMRKTPEGWQASLRRMAGLYGVQVDPDAARRIVRYLADHHGIAPEELRPALFEVERVRTDFEYPEEETREVCAACHSLGRVITQRRTVEEWKLLAETHRGLYPIVDRQTFRSGGRENGSYPVDRVLEHLAERHPLSTPEWDRWANDMRPPRLGGAWALSGNEDGAGPIFGRMEVTPVPGEVGEFTTSITYVRARTGETIRRSGEALVYTGYQWRGRSQETSGEGEELREVLFVEPGWREMHGRWFTGGYDEIGVKVKLVRLGLDPVVSGVRPQGLRAGLEGAEVQVYGSNLPSDVESEDVDLGTGVRVTSVLSASSEVLDLVVDVDEGAPVGPRRLRVRDAVLPEAAVVYDRIHSVRVEPETGMARVGGATLPKELEFFEAVGYLDGPDGETGTDDDVRIGELPVEWSIAEYPVTYEDDDVEFVGEIDETGRFTPALDGPNPERRGNRNNVGDVWVVATYRPPAEEDGSRPLRGRAHLVVTVPLYIRFEPWPTPAEELRR